VSDSLGKLHPPSAPLAQAMTATIDTVVRAGRPPRAELAMEVATAILYLEAAFQDLDPNDSHLAARTQRLAERLGNVTQGGNAEPLESWMEELYRRVSDRQTMGSVVGELRGTLGELEKLLDQFFRNTQDKTPLRDAPGHLSQMRGVLSVLGLDQASQAVARMREAVEEIIVTEIDDEHARAAGTFEKLGNNLGALGFLIDMLNYQPALAKKLFIYEESSGELRPLMGRTSAPEAEEPAAAGAGGLSQEVQSVVAEAGESGLGELGPRLDTLAAHAVLAQNTGVANAARDAAAAVSAQNVDAAAAALSTLAASAQPASAPPPAAPAEPDIEEEDLRDIFLEEAREVVGNGLAAIEALASNPSDLSELTTLRRAFHTLKGSSRMVGLTEFGEAAWSMEQVLNTWLADQKPASDDLRTISAQAMQGFGRWVEDIATHADAGWKAGMFRQSADAFRTDNRLVPFALPAAADAPANEADQVLATITMEARPDTPMALDVAVADAASVPTVEPELTIELIEPPVQPEIAEPPTARRPEVVDLTLDAFPFEPERAEPHAVVEPPPVSEPEAAALAAEAFEFEPQRAEAPALDRSEPTLVVDDAAPAQPVEVSFGETMVIRGEPAQAAEVPLDQLPPEFELELGAEADVPPATEPPVEIAGIDFASLSAVAGPTPPAAEAAAEPVAEGMDASSMRDEQVKVIGTLRIGIPLYNVYLNEADEWSRRLATEVGEWALEMNQRVPDSTVGLAHALGGSSATVGFNVLSDVARALEAALQQTQSLAYGTHQHARAFTGAADEIRRLLHQFAAGFLKEPDPRVVEALHALRDLDIPQRADASDSVLPGSDFADLEPIEVAPSPVEPVADEPVPQPSAVMELPPEAPPVVAPEAPPPNVVETFAMPVAAAPATPQRPSVANVQLVGDDDIDVADAIDPDLFPIFEEEAAELMPQLGSSLRLWAGRPDNRAPRDEVLRALHTLKGSARLAGALRLGEMAHRMESEIEYLGTDKVNPADIDDLLHRFDNMQAAFDNLRAGGGLPGAEPPVEVATKAADPAPHVAPPEAQRPIDVLPATGLPTPVQAAIRTALAQPATTALNPARQAANQAVRVRSQLLDRLVNQAGEVMITRSRLEAELKQLRGSLSDLTGNLDRLRAQLRDIELQAESQMQSRLAQAKDSAAGFDPLEFDRFTRVQELTRMMAESVNDVATVQRNIQRVVESTEDDLIAQARQTRELQRDLLRTRMVEFEGISDRLYRVVRLAAKETGKQVKLDILGGSIEMDRGVLDRMTPAFEHLLRNCVAHGIEEPQRRSAAGKDASGNIAIQLHHEGNDVSVSFQDDGAGLNLPRIREKALQQGLITPEQQLTDGEAANLIFLPGFSTATQVTELSGRGIGMDVVRAEVNALGGRIETSTQAGQGTTFKLVLPLTTAVTQVVMIRSGKLAIGVPANLIELVRRATAKEIEQAYNSGSYEFGGVQLPFHWSGALLQSSAHSVEPQGKTAPVVIFRSAAQRVAVHVDEVLGNQEVVVKNLGPQLSRLPGLAGMTVLASGAVVLIYNPVALTQVYGEQARLLSADRAQPEVLEQAASRAPTMPAVPTPPAVPLVLVVDDSITVRRVTQRLLQREGYRVSMAADGLQALERLAEERPSVVLSDIEMPRMDGFDLARNIRGDQRLASLPIIMITSRIAEKHREHAKELGVDHYLGKPYSEEELLSLVKHYCTTALIA
jgi:chemosensory pili system protein ChpA (sensor histidine kinase/response regulator)